MTLTIRFTPEEESRIRWEAAQSGLKPADYLHGLIIQNLPPPVEPAKELTDEEWEELFDKLAEGSEELPVLPPEAFTREYIYGDHP
jgi:hypothetical protein